MPVGVLDKIVSMLVVGTIVALGLVIALGPRAVAGTLGGLPGPAGVALATLVGAPLMLSLGALADAIAEQTVRRVITGRHRMLPPDRVARVLLQGDIQRAHGTWKGRFADIARSHPALARLDLPGNEADGRQGIARGPANEWDDVSQVCAALFLSRASREHFEWVTAHHATYYLASALAVALVVVAGGALIGLGLAPEARVLLAAGAVAAIYLLCSLAADRYCYAHLCLYRFGCLDLAGTASGSGTAVTPLPTTAPRD